MSPFLVMFLFLQILKKTVAFSSKISSLSIARESKNQIAKPHFFPNCRERCRSKNSKTSEDTQTWKDISSLEKEVFASAQANVDLKRVTDLLLEENEKSVKHTEEELLYPSSWTISLAAGTISAFSSFIIWHNSIASLVFFITAYLLASGDPLEEDGVTGSISRIVGRSTLSFLYSIKPRFFSVLRAVLDGDGELFELRDRIKEVEEENKVLKLILRRKVAVENALPNYTLDKLKDICKENGVSGYTVMTKEKLLYNLVEKGIIDL